MAYIYNMLYKQLRAYQTNIFLGKNYIHINNIINNLFKNLYKLLQHHGQSRNLGDDFCGFIFHNLTTTNKCINYI